MPIAKQNDKETVKMVEEEFRDETELQSCLERSPYLLMSDLEPQVVTVQREVSLRAAGSLDLLLVDKEGVPIAVEVKLSRNSQSRREVVAQAFDYVSDLTQLTVDELDDLVEGALVNALDELTGESSSGNLRKQCGTNLRAGRVKLVIAVDQANDDLVRIVRYINEHSDLDVRLVAISKFDNGGILVPRILVSGKKDEDSGTSKEKLQKMIDPYFQSVLDTYNREAADPLKTRGQGRSYRQIRPDAWPSMLHYEYLNYQDEIGAEIHLESDQVRPLANLLQQFSGSRILDNIILAWDPRWSRGRGRLIAKMGKDQDIRLAVKAMHELISLTLEPINKEIEKLPR